MADISKLNIDGTDYNVKDPTARSGLSGKQPTLVSGTNIKTINGKSLLGSGNLSVEGSGSMNYIELAKSIISQYQHQMYQTAVAVDEKTVDIILFAGQSNMCGRAAESDCVTSKDIFVTTTIDKGFSFNNGSSTTPQAIVEPITANGSTGYGLIPSFINAYYATTRRKICACYMSSGGVMLNKFLPYTIDSSGAQVDTPTTYYNNMVNYVNDAKSKLASNGYTVGHIFLAWCQGEADAVYYGSTNNYANVIEQGLTEEQDKIDYYIDAFSKLLAALKTDAGVEKAFIVRIGNKRSKDTLLQSIINAQSELCKVNDDCVLVSTILAGAKTFEEEDGTTRDLMRDDSHYVPEGYLRCGTESGVNAGIYVNSQFRSKPILMEYNNLYLEAKGLFEEKENARKVDKYIYDPNRVDIFTMANISGATVTPEEPDTGETDTPDDPVIDTGTVVFDYDFTANNIDDYALDNVFTVPTGSDTSSIAYDSTYGMALNGQLPNGLDLVTPIDSSKAWTLEMTALIVTPTVVANNRKAIIAGDSLYPFLFANFSSASDTSTFRLQVCNDSNKSYTWIDLFAFDEEHNYKFVYDGNGTFSCYRDDSLIKSCSTTFAGEFTVILGNVSGQSTAYIWKNVESNPSYLHKLKFKYD